jgi:Pyruvate/2-oxoacid:ferredoxin oxidoreductase delta subunit
LRFKEATCLRCAKACPRDAIRIGGRIAVGSRCDGCGVCVAACPNSVFVPRQSETTRLIQSARDVTGEERAVVFRCSQAPSEDPAAAVPCLGAIPLFALLAAVEAGAATIRLVRGDCSGCKWARGIALFEATLLSFTSLCETLGAVPNAVVTDVSAPEAVAGTGFSAERRDVFRLLARPFRRVAESTAPEAPRRHGIWKRELLLRSIGVIAPRREGELWPDRTGFGMIAIGPGCSACKLCALACPARAIRTTESKGELVLTFAPAVCTGCRACVDVCPASCIRFAPADLRSVLTGERVVVQQFPMTVCRGCGTAFVSSQDRLCDVCTKRGGLHP